MQRLDEDKDLLGDTHVGRVCVFTLLIGTLNHLDFLSF